MRYTPSLYLPDEFRDEFRRLADSLRSPDVEAVFLAQLNAQPAKYADGMLVYADGTNWNPGSGEGAYLRCNSAWNYLG